MCWNWIIYCKHHGPSNVRVKAMDEYCSYQRQRPMYADEQECNEKNPCMPGDGTIDPNDGEKRPGFFSKQ